MKELEKAIGYSFKNKDILKTALTHSSYIKEKNMPRTMCNERLEFLGDAVLGAVISDYLYNELPEEREGGLTKIKTDLVRANSLAQFGRSIDIGSYLLLGNGEITTKGYDKESILENAVEAIIGAVFVESGYKQTSEVVINMLEDQIEKAMQGEVNIDYKTTVQEIIQSKGNYKIEYQVVGEKGKSHDKTFYVELKIDDVTVGKGTGKSKKTAENQAAKIAIKTLKS